MLNAVTRFQIHSFPNYVLEHSYNRVTLLLSTDSLTKHIRVFIAFVIFSHTELSSP